LTDDLEERKVINLHGHKIFNRHSKVLKCELNVFTEI